MVEVAVALTRLQAGDIEMVRAWRNHADVAGQMEYRETITAEMQARWFGSINNGSNYYFLLRVDDEAAGLLNLKNVDVQAGTGESGIFLAPGRVLDGMAVFAAAIGLTDFAFATLGLRELRAHILKGNRRAIRQSTGIGYALDAGQEAIENQRYRVTPEAYRAATARFRSLIAARFSVRVQP